VLGLLEVNKSHPLENFQKHMNVTEECCYFKVIT